MAQWEKALARMLNDTNPNGYTYDEAARVLFNLGFTLAAASSGSHRRWARRAAGVTVVIGLIEKGHGHLKPYLIRDLISQLKTNGLVPSHILKP